MTNLQKLLCKYCNALKESEQVETYSEQDELDGIRKEQIDLHGRTLMLLLSETESAV